MTFFKHQFYSFFFLSFFKTNLNRRAFRFVIMTVLYGKKYSGLFEQLFYCLKISRVILSCVPRALVYYRFITDIDKN